MNWERCYRWNWEHPGECSEYMETFSVSQLRTLQKKLPWVLKKEPITFCGSSKSVSHSSSVEEWVLKTPAMSWHFHTSGCLCLCQLGFPIVFVEMHEIKYVLKVRHFNIVVEFWSFYQSWQRAVASNIKHHLTEHLSILMWPLCSLLVA